MKSIVSAAMSALCCFSLFAAVDSPVTDHTGTLDPATLKTLGDRAYFINLNDVSMCWFIFPELPQWVEDRAAYLKTNELPSNTVLFLIGRDDGKIQVLFGGDFDSFRRRQVAPWVENVIDEKFVPAASDGRLVDGIADSMSAFEISAKGIKNNYDNLTWLLACGVLALGAFLLWERRERRKANIYLAGLMVAALAGVGIYAAVVFLKFTPGGDIRRIWTSRPAATASTEPAPATASSVE